MPRLLPTDTDDLNHDHHEHHDQRCHQCDNSDHLSYDLVHQTIVINPTGAGLQCRNDMHRADHSDTVNGGLVDEGSGHRI